MEDEWIESAGSVSAMQMKIYVQAEQKGASNQFGKCKIKERETFAPLWKRLEQTRVYRWIPYKKAKLSDPRWSCYKKKIQGY